MHTLIRTLLIGAGLLITSLAQAAPPAGWTALLEPQALATMPQHEIRIIQVTGDFTQSHIPGSAHTPYPSFRGPQSNPGELPPLSDLTRVVQTAGIEANTPVVVVHQGSSPPDMGAATRVYWTLKSLGVEHVAVLNGGLAAWTNAGLPVSSEPAVVTPSRFEPQWNARWQARADEILDSLGAERLQLVDSRPAAFYLGQQSAASRAGTIPGASNMSFEQFFDGARMFAPQRLTDIVDAADLANAPTVTFCNSGQLGSIGWFVLSEIAGMTDVRLYAESMTEWADLGYPMANEPE